MDELEDILIAFQDAVADRVENLQIESKQDYINLVLYMAGKAIRSFREVICLSAVGFPDGALTISRSLYELCMVLRYIEFHRGKDTFPKIVEDYYTNFDIERYKALAYKAINYSSDGDEARIIQENIPKAKQSAHHTVTRDYWWMGCRTFADVVDSVIKDQANENERTFLHGLQLAYKRASMSLHTNAFGDIVRLGAEEDNVVIDTLPTTRGQELPLYLATASFIPVVCITCIVLGLDYEVHRNKLHDIALFYSDFENDRTTSTIVPKPPADLE